MIYQTYMSLNKTNPNGDCWGWQGYCTVHNADSLRHAAAIATMTGTLELINTHSRDGRIRSVYKDGLGRYVAVEADKAEDDGKRLFTYPEAYELCQEYRKYSGQVCTIVRTLTEDEADPPFEDEGEQMYLVRFDDGFEGSVFESELSAVLIS